MLKKTTRATPDNANLHPWWENLRGPQLDGGSGFRSWAQSGLTERAIRTGECFYQGRAHGQVGDRAAEVLKNIDNYQQGRRVYEKVTRGNEHPSEVAWVWADGAVVVDYYEEDHEISVWVMSSDKEVATSIIDLMRKHIVLPKPEGRCYIIGMTDHGPEFYNLGTASVPLIRDNYTPEVMVKYDELISDLRSSSPKGRLGIADGPPGSGKTFLIRAMLDAVPDAQFVFVLPNMVDTLASPSLIPLLIRRKRSYGAGGPIVFILEDGDNVLTPRGKDNLSLISTLLNMTSGILGSMLDIRAIATTNSPTRDIDPALMRPGRLSVHMTINYLPRPQAEAVFKRLVGSGKKLPSESDMNKFLSPGENFTGITLAMVYGAARDNGWSPEETVNPSGSLEGRVVNSRLLGEDFMVYPDTRARSLLT